MTEQPLGVELEQESDGRWHTEVVELPGVLAYGATRDAALATVSNTGNERLELNNPPSA